jgi:very-short-patch-repair endonuclease
VLETAFEHARRLGLTSPDALEQRASALSGAGRPGSRRIRALLARVDSAALESRLEVRTRKLLRSSSLPPPIAQYRVGRFRIDSAWPRSRVGCECDGFEAHGYRLAWKRDRRRLAAIESAGWRIVSVTWDDVTKRPKETLERLAIALRAAA